MNAGNRAPTRGGQDAQRRFHRHWLGLAQPVEGLVFSLPVLAEAQIAPDTDASLSGAFHRWLDSHDGDEAPIIKDLVSFFCDFLGYQRGATLVMREDLPDNLHFYAEEGRQEIRPSFALARERLAAPGRRR